MKRAIKSTIDKGKALVDPECPNNEDVHVYYEGNDIYDVLLYRMDLKKNKCRFCILQLLEMDRTPGYFVWTRWGSIGNKRDRKLSDCLPLSYATDLFLKKFFDKTKNRWQDRKTFIKYKRMYEVVEKDYFSKDLITLISNKEAMKSRVAELKYDSDKVPLGKLSEDQIKAGYSALTKISGCIIKIEKLKTSKDDTPNTIKDRGGAKKQTKSNNSLKRLKKKLLKHCKTYYTHIPHKFSMRVPPLINTDEQVKAEINLLESLSDIEFAMQLLDDTDDERIIQSTYDKLNCNITELDPNDQQYKLICDYFYTTRGSTHSSNVKVLNVFECTKPNETERFCDYGSRMLLWHGSRLTNWCGILGRGLQIAPPEAPASAYMFGKGVYFTDCSTKSANYVYPSEANNYTGLMALCEVSLGRSRKRTLPSISIPKNSYNSVKAVGTWQSDSRKWKKMDDGVIVPAAELIHGDHQFLLYNEYIVYNVNQVRLRYLLKIKFE